MDHLAIALALVATFAVLPFDNADARERRPDADARHCLELPTTHAIIKCAERYL